MKKFLTILFIVFVSGILYLSPLKNSLLQLIYPYYTQLLDKGYRYEEIKQFYRDLDDQQVQFILSSDYSLDILRQAQDDEYRYLIENNYSILDADHILNLSNELKSFYLNHENVIEYQTLIEHDYFVIDFYDRYVDLIEKSKELTVVDVLRRVNTLRDRPLYTKIQSADLSVPSLILVNKYYQLPEDFIPNLEESYLGFMMEEEAAIALDQLCEAMETLNLNFSISNTYRSYDLQTSIYNRYLETQSQAVVDTYSARAGHSEHQAGLAVDFKTKTKDISYFENSDAYAWLVENAHNYGFIQRYTLENSFYTGYQAEAWHFRYIGKELATIVYETKLTLEEVLLLYR